MVDGVFLLKEDHKAVKRLFREIEKKHKIVGAQAKRALYEKMLMNAEHHAEEETAAAKPKAPADPLALMSAKA